MILRSCDTLLPGAKPPLARGQGTALEQNVSVNGTYLSYAATEDIFVACSQRLTPPSAAEETSMINVL